MYKNKKVLKCVENHDEVLNWFDGNENKIEVHSLDYRFVKSDYKNRTRNILNLKETLKNVQEVHVPFECLKAKSA